MNKMSAILDRLFAAMYEARAAALTQPGWTAALFLMAVTTGSLVAFDPVSNGSFNHRYQRTKKIGKVRSALSRTLVLIGLALLVNIYLEGVPSKRIVFESKEMLTSVQADLVKLRQHAEGHGSIGSILNAGSSIFSRIEGDMDNFVSFLIVFDICMLERADDVSLSLCMYTQVNTWTSMPCKKPLNLTINRTMTAPLKSGESSATVASSVTFSPEPKEVPKEAKAAEKSEKTADAPVPEEKAEVQATLKPEQHSDSNVQGDPTIPAEQASASAPSTSEAANPSEEAAQSNDSASPALPDDMIQVL